MSVRKFYRYENKVLIPTIKISANGLFIETAPVTVCDIANEEMLHSVIKTALLSEIKNSDSASQEEETPSSAILAVIGLSKWEELERNALMYTVYSSGPTVQIHITGRAENGLWKVDDTQTISLPKEDAERVLADTIYADIIQRKPIPDKPVRLLAAPKTDLKPLD